MGERMYDEAGWTGTPVPRRRVLGGALAGLAGLVTAGLASPRSAAARDAATYGDPVPLPPIDTPDQALRELVEGNRRFVSGRITAPHRNLARVREVAPAQSPFAAVLGCADSRVPVELVFDQGFGDVFVCRTAGNVVSSEVIGSLEFGALVLGAKVLVVLGHTSCGAVKATVDGTPAPGQISSLYHRIRPAVDRAGGSDVARATEENARMQAALLASSSPVLSALVREGKLKVVAGVYRLNTGEVSWLDGAAG